VNSGKTLPNNRSRKLAFVTDTHWLFSYGTLQDADVQQATFGRVLGGNSDSLPGFRTELVEIIDQKVIETSGRTHHPIVVFTGDDSDSVDGTVFAITEDELDRADAYEVDDYTRVGVTLRSGITSWVYVQAF
jgi:gamma-glutamyl AIG2-like cyclotransferase